jgi:hypothetical protein
VQADEITGRSTARCIHRQLRQQKPQLLSVIESTDKVCIIDDLFGIGVIQTASATFADVALTGDGEFAWLLRRTHWRLRQATDGAKLKQPFGAALQLWTKARSSF